MEADWMNHKGIKYNSPLPDEVYLLLCVEQGDITKNSFNDEKSI